MTRTSWHKHKHPYPMLKNFSKIQIDREPTSSSSDEEIVDEKATVGSVSSSTSNSMLYPLTYCLYYQQIFSSYSVV